MLNISGIEDILPRHQEISNGSKKEYTVAFDLIDTKFVSVYLGSEKQTTGYSVDIENKKVTFNSAPTTGLLVTIVRVVPASWESELHGALNSDSLNILFTKIIASLQTIKEEVNRSLKSNVFDENNSEQKFEFFLKQLADAQDVLTRSENNLSLLETTGQDSLNSINTARDNALEDIEEIRSETISEVTELTSSLLDYSNITNCITEIPQDIKLELVDGVLTLKAGSKVYVPNGKNADGSNKFDVLIVDVDKRLAGSPSGKSFFIINSLSKNVAAFTLDTIYSGSEPPVSSASNILWYDTGNNIIKNSVDKGVTWSNKMGFPLCIYTAENTVITSIDQVFNGFGYIDSTIFALPGVKGLIPNGRNADGSLKNIEMNIGSVKIKTLSQSSLDGVIIADRYGALEATLWLGNLDNDPQSATQFSRYYNTKTNYVRFLGSSGNWTNQTGFGYFADIAYTSGTVTSFQPKLPFRAIDAQDVMFKQDEATAVNYDNITNCITEIPQDIKLELNNGTLTLKAGSKVYLAYGTLGNSNTVTSDITATNTSNGQYMVIRSGLTAMYLANINSCLSGVVANRPASLSTNTGLYFATDENILYLTGNKGTDWYSGTTYSLPLAIVTVSNGAISNIDQVFNGFGYIGSTVFALPGVKGLKPNGRNADGSLRNVEFTLYKVLTNTTYRPSTNGYLICAGNATAIQKSAVKSNWYYDEDNNYVSTLAGDKSWMIWGEYITDENDSITSFQPKLPFRAVDQNDFNKLDSEVAKLDEENTFTGNNTFTGKTQALTPPAGDNSSQIVTSEWCYDPTKSTNLLHRTGDETSSGVKTFNDAIIRREAFSGASPYTVRAVDTNGKGSIAIIPYYTANTIYHRILAANTTVGKDASFDVTIKDDGTASVFFSGSASTKNANFNNVTNFLVPTPAEGDNSQRAVNTAYLNSVMPTITYWD